MATSNRNRSDVKISRTKVDLFHECPRCFYLDRVKGISRPPGFPLTLNNAVDRLLKAEFDQYRLLAQPHPLLKAAGIELVPFPHPQLDEWRTNTKGLKTVYKGITFSGVPDDIWRDENDTLYIVDYKATANSKGPVKELTESSFHVKYIRQLEFYQWLLEKNGFSVSRTGYLVYATGNSALPGLNGILQFHLELIPVQSNWNWVEPELDQLLDCLRQDEIPEAKRDCHYCQFVKQQRSL